MVTRMPLFLPETQGTIIARYADVGQKVAKGQVLAQIDDQQYRNQMESLGDSV